MKPVMINYHLDKYKIVANNNKSSLALLFGILTVGIFFLEEKKRREYSIDAQYKGYHNKEDKFLRNLLTGFNKRLKVANKNNKSPYWLRGDESLKQKLKHQVIANA